MIPVFLSIAAPYLERQQEFLDCLRSYLIYRQLEPKTVGETEYSMDVPLVAVRRLELECYGVLAVAFRRSYIVKGVMRPGADLPSPDDPRKPKYKPTDISDTWETSPWIHIEAAMAFQLGLPVLIIRENGVRSEGMLDQTTSGLYAPTPFDLDKPCKDYFRSVEWKQLIGQWEAYVHSVFINKSTPPKLF